MGAVSSSLRKSLSDMFSALKGRKKASLAILGLDASGKSTLVNLFRDINLPTYPTLGFNVEEINFNNTSIKIWDVGGQKEFIAYWKQYVDGIDGLVFMIDIADEKRFQDSFNGFKTLVPHLRDGLSVLLLLNKIDLIGEKEDIDNRVGEVEKIYGVDHTRSSVDSYMKVDDKLFKTRICKISVKKDLERMNTDATTTIQHSSVYSGFKWLIDDIKNNESRV